MRYTRSIYIPLTSAASSGYTFASVMRPTGSHLFTVLFSLFALAACEKKEQPIVLPPIGAALPGRVDMGGDYSAVIYYDFEHNAVVKTSQLAAWDLAFEAAADGRHLFLNGGTNVTVLNTHRQDFDDVTSLPPNAQPGDWRYDAPSGNPDSTAVGDWCGPGGSNPHRDVYIVQLAPNRYKKLQLVSVNAQQYVIRYGEMNAHNPTELIVPKTAEYNFDYFSFTSGIVTPEPPKASWDVVFTRYKEMIFDNAVGHAIPYPVNGALLNPEHTTVGIDSLDAYAAIDLGTARSLPVSSLRNSVGYDWKQYNFGTGRYEVNPRKVFVLHTRNNHLIKMHFIDFYSAQGVAGSPGFESEVIE